MTDETAKPSRVKALADKLTKHDAQSGPVPSWVGYVALLTGILAGIAGFLTVRATVLTNNAIYESNQAILAQAQSSDAWNEYQADSIKARIIETQLAANPALDAQSRTRLEGQAQDFRNRQPKIQGDAQNFAKDRDDHLAAGKGLLATRDMLSYADLATQLAIALASVAAMVRVRRAFDAAIVVGVIGVVIALFALGRQYLAGGGFL
ncbi:MAG TPA: DUF4337 family protein [Stellaceae bacterium]|jgi:Domain of unknown function (DUF4337)|nr:DUF4337 family protein [Stellaceae bacterium]